MFVPLLSQGGAHLVSAKNFEANKDPQIGPQPFEPVAAVPNTFLYSGTVDVNQSKGFLSLPAAAQAGKRNDTQPIIVHGFIRIENHTKITATPFDFFYNSYSYRTGTILDRLIQRIREIWPNFDLGESRHDLYNLLRSEVLPPGESAYIYVGNYEGDPTDTKPVVMRRESEVRQRGAFILPYIGEQPDGFANSNFHSSTPHYQIIFIPSSGFNNLLAVIKFWP